jgi:uncharacterized damage-inducible protein DinB
MRKIISLVFISQIAFVLAFSSACYAQAPTAEDIRSQMLKDWTRAKAYTVDYLNTMPADKYSFKAVDSIRSFAQQMLHLASGNVFLMSNATGQQPLPWLMSDPEHRESAQKKDSVMYYVTASYDYCTNAVKTFDMSKWNEKQKMFNTYEETRLALMNKTFEHQTHHRGQTTIYIRLQGIKPPQERLF